MDPNNQPVQPVQPLQTAQPAPATPAAPAAASSDQYISNPFLVTTDGLARILYINPASSLLATVYILLLFIPLAIAAGLASIVSSVLALVIFGVGVVLLLIILTGMLYVIAGASADNEEVTLGASFKRTISRLIPYIALNILGFLIVLVGFVLLIIPGIYLLARTALAPVVFFEENLGPIASLKRSFALTKGHVFEVLSAIIASQVLSGGGGGLLAMPVSVAPLTGRYRNLKQLITSGAPKPKTHWLNFALPFIALLIVGLYIGYFAFTFSQIEEDVSNPESSTSQDFYDFSEEDLSSPGININ